MTNRTRRVMMASVVLGASSVAVGADELKAVEKRITKAWQEHTSMRSKVEMIMQLKQQGAVIKGKAQGSYEFIRKGKKVLFRQEMEGQNLRKIGGQEMKQEYRITTISDGTYVYSLMDVDGRKFATKKREEPGTSPDPERNLGMLRKSYRLKLLPSEKSDGQKVYVIEASPKRKGGPKDTKRHLHYREDGILVKHVVCDPAGDPMMTSTHTDIQFDVKIDPKRFVFKAPLGVTVQELRR